MEGTATCLASVKPSDSVVPKCNTSGAHATTLLGLTRSKKFADDTLFMLSILLFT